jgi:hypothetical protein
MEGEEMEERWGGRVREENYMRKRIGRMRDNWCWYM